MVDWSCILIILALAHLPYSLRQAREKGESARRCSRKAQAAALPLPYANFCRQALFLPFSPMPFLLPRLCPFALLPTALISFFAYFSPQYTLDTVSWSFHIPTRTSSPQLHHVLTQGIKTLDFIKPSNIYRLDWALSIAWKDRIDILLFKYVSSCAATGY